MTPRAFRTAIALLGLSQGQAARLFGVCGRTVRYWATGPIAVPELARRLLVACERYPDLVPALMEESEEIRVRKEIGE